MILVSLHGGAHIDTKAKDSEQESSERPHRDTEGGLTLTGSASQGKEDKGRLSVVVMPK